jgi:hypothetical protein
MFEGKREKIQILSSVPAITGRMRVPPSDSSNKCMLSVIISLIVFGFALGEVTIAECPKENT